MVKVVEARSSPLLNFDNNHCDSVVRQTIDHVLEDTEPLHPDHKAIYRYLTRALPLQYLEWPNFIMIIRYLRSSELRTIVPTNVRGLRRPWHYVLPNIYQYKISLLLRSAHPKRSQEKSTLPSKSGENLPENLYQFQCSSPGD